MSLAPRDNPDGQEETGIVKVGESRRMSPTRARAIYVASLSPAMMERVEEFRAELRMISYPADPKRTRSERLERIAEMKEDEPELIEAMEAIAQYRKEAGDQAMDEARQIGQVSAEIEGRMYEAMGDKFREAANQTTPRRPSGAPPAGGSANDGHRRTG